MYYATKLSFYLSVLNSDDDQTRHTARQSLELHMKKRGCEEADLHQENVAGFTTDSNYRVIKISNQRLCGASHTGSASMNCAAS